MEKISGIILAGGRASRMGGEDKGLTPLLGEPMIAHVIHRIQRQLTTLVISANRNQAQYQQFGFPVVSDHLNTFEGPLAGIARGMEAVETPLVLVTPCDTPLLPLDLVSRLQQTLLQSNRPIAVAEGDGRLQPLCFLARRTLLDSVNDSLQQGERRVHRWMDSLRPAHCHFDTPDAFININRPEQRSALEQSLQADR